MLGIGFGSDGAWRWQTPSRRRGLAFFRAFHQPNFTVAARSTADGRDAVVAVVAVPEGETAKSDLLPGVHRVCYHHGQVDARCVGGRYTLLGPCEGHSALPVRTRRSDG